MLALPLALLLAVAAAVVPPAAAPVVPLLAGFDAPVARAADGLAVTTDARYVVVPDKAVVRATVDVTVRNETPDRVAGGVITRYFFDGVNLGVQREATRIRATQDGAAVPVKVVTKSDYKLVTIGFRRNIYFQESARVRLTFDLPAGKPRSASDIRVGKAFATFLAWAFGDSGSVRIEVPGPFAVGVSGEDMQRSSSGGATVLTATTSDAAGWYAWVTARNDDALTRERLDIKGGEEIIVRGWPEDRRWRQTVADLLTRGVPGLVARIGLAWPVDGPLRVIEIHTPLLEGYAGFYDTAKDEITVSEELDALTVVHEASHAWFNDELFTERWIKEGLADEYASRVLGSLGEKIPGPADVSRKDKVAFPLSAWPSPAAIRDDESGAREQYGYDASWLVMRQVVRAVGEDGMRRVFRAASDRTTAYLGAGKAERAKLPNDWRRFVDLTEELGGATGIAGLVATWALPPGPEAELRAREQARAAYRVLRATGGDWSAPYAVRGLLDGWAFADAEARIGDATAVIEQRDETAALAATQGLTPPDEPETAYEAALDEAGLQAAASLAADTQAALETVAAAGVAAAMPRDWIVSLGLDGWDPDLKLREARAAWEGGDVTGAAGGAALVSGRLAAAPSAGRDRVTLIGAGTGGAVLVLVIAIWLVRRRTRRTRSARLAVVAPVTASTAGTWPSADDPSSGMWPSPSVSSSGTWPPAAGPSALPSVPPASGPGAIPTPSEAPDQYATLPASEGLPRKPVPPPTEEEGAEPS